MMRIGEEVEVSEGAFEVKAWFAERPSRAVIEEFRSHIKEGRPPYEWRGHTHTRPPHGANIVYLAEFGLAAERASPCPCCSPKVAKFWRQGMFAWFPDEQVIRAIGHKCFATLNPEGHATALHDYVAENKRRFEEEYLLMNYGKIGELKTALEEGLPVFEAIDEVRNILSERVDGIVGKNLLEHVESGVLSVLKDHEYVVIDKDGNPEKRHDQLPARYATITGQVMLKKNSKRLALAIKSALSNLSNIQMPERATLRSAIASLTDEQRRQIFTRLSISLNVSREVWAQAEDARSFLSPVTVATINTWSQQPGSPVDIQIKRSGREVLIGTSRVKPKRMVLPEAFERSLKTLPKMGGDTNG